MRSCKIITCLLITATLLILSSGRGFCRLNLPQQQQQTVIKGEEHETLRDFFGRFEVNRSKGLTSDPVRLILIRALPEIYRDGCNDMITHWGSAAEGTAGMSVRVLHTEGRKEGAPIRALLAYSCFSKAEEYGNKFRDERLAALVVDRRASRLTMLADGKDCETCPDLAQITLDKVIKLFGRTVVGLSFVTSTENPGYAGSFPQKEERVNFYVIKDDGLKRAGSVLRMREQYEHDDADGDVKVIYTAGLVLKKDMKGNIIGILSPYKVKKNGKTSGKGMVRFNWSMESEEFVRE